MKIALYSDKNNKRYASRLIKILEGYAPHHQYNHCAEGDDPDLWHCLMPNDSMSFIGKAHRSVVTLSDISFILSPELFSLSDRLFRLPLYRYHCRHAARLIAHNNQIKRSVVEHLGISQDRVEICEHLFAAHNDHAERVLTPQELLDVREKMDLAESYILIVGQIDTMHGHTTALHAILEQPQSLNVVIYGRRTTHSDVLLVAVRDLGVADRVQFIYECDQRDLGAIYRMALVVIYLPSFDSSVSPILEAMCQRSPMILSQTPLNVETAGQAAVYVQPYDLVALVAAIKMVLYNESFRGQLIAQCRVESRRYSSKGVAERLAEIYEGV